MSEEYKSQTGVLIRTADTLNKKDRLIKGEIDEVYASNANICLEYMDNDEIFLSINDIRFRIFTRHGAHIYMMAESENDNDNIMLYPEHMR